MSFGYSIGDGLLLVQLAWNTVQGARKACGEYDELTVEASSLHKVLQRLQRELANPDSLTNRADDDRRQELDELSTGADQILKVMNSVLIKYNALEDNKKSGKKLWQKIKFGNGETRDLAEIRQKLSIHTSAILMSLNLCSLGSQGRVENRLNKLEGSLQGIERKVDWAVAGMVAQTGEGSVWTSYAEDDKAFWRGLRHELVQEGYTSSTLQKHKGLIKAYVEELGKLGVFDEIASDMENFPEPPEEINASQPTSGLQSIISVEDSELPSLPVDQRTSLLQPGSKDLQETIEVPAPPNIRGMSGGSVSTSPIQLDERSKESRIPTEITAPPNSQGTSSGSISAFPVQLDEVLDDEFAPGTYPNADICTTQVTQSQNQPPSFTENQQIPPATDISNMRHLAWRTLPSPLRAPMQPIFETGHDTIYWRHGLPLFCNRGAPPVTASLLEAHGLPYDFYNPLHWDPREEPILIAGNILDVYSLSRWIRYWVVATWGEKSKEIGLANVFSNVVRNFARLHKELSVKLEESADDQFIAFLQESLKQSNDLWKELRQLFKSHSAYLEEQEKSEIQYIKSTFDFNDVQTSQSPILLETSVLGFSAEQLEERQKYWARLDLFAQSDSGRTPSQFWLNVSNSMVDFLITIHKFNERANPITKLLARRLRQNRNKGWKRKDQTSSKSTSRLA